MNFMAPRLSLKGGDKPRPKLPPERAPLFAPPRKTRVGIQRVINLSLTDHKHTETTNTKL